MDREAAKAAFADFLASKTLSGNRIHFIDLIINDLTDNRVMAAARLYESPFTDVAAQGPECLLQSADVDVIISSSTQCGLRQTHDG
jgi:type I restriction enzyme R subunit